MLSVAGGNTLFSIADGPPTMPLVQGGISPIFAGKSGVFRRSVQSVSSPARRPYSDFAGGAATQMPRGPPP
jgi:hypothetical protein